MSNQIACCDKHGDEYVAEIRNMAEARTEMKEVNKLRRELYEQEKEERAERKDIAAQTLVLIQGIKNDGERVTAIEKAIAERKISFGGGPGEFNKKQSMTLLSQWIMGTLQASPKGLNDPTYLDAVRKTLTTGGATSGTQFVPVELAAQVYQLLEDEGMAFAKCTRIPMDTMTEDIADPGAVTLAWQSVLGGEGTAATDQTPTTGKATLAADTLIATMPITKQLLRTSKLPLVQIYTTRFVRRMSREFDKQILAGTGAPFTGISGTTSVNEVVITALGKPEEVTFAYIADLIAEMTNEGLRGAEWFFHPTMEAALRKIVTGISGDTTAIWAPPGGDQPATIYGIPYTKSWEMLAATGSDQLNKIFMILGNLENALLGIVEDLSFAVSDQVAFRAYIDVLRAVMVGAIAFPDPTAFGRMKTGAS